MIYKLSSFNDSLCHHKTNHFISLSNPNPLLHYYHHSFHYHYLDPKRLFPSWEIFGSLPRSPQIIKQNLNENNKRYKNQKKI